MEGGVQDVLDTIRPIKKTIDELQRELRISRNQPLATDRERDKMAQCLWSSLATADQAVAQTSSSLSEQPVKSDEDICRRILGSLEFQDMRAREGQIKDPFPDTFQWLLAYKNVEASARQPTDFKEWLISEADELPFWITGKPASGKSTLMKFICNEPQVQNYLETWSGKSCLLTCSAYFWYPGSPEQKSQPGLLKTLLSQLLRQRFDLCRQITARRYSYFQLAGMDSPAPDWTLEELKDAIIRFLSRVEGTSRVAMFVDGLDEFDGVHEDLVSFLKLVHSRFKIKLCISSRPWNVFRDAFCTYPSLKMEAFTRPDIEKYVSTHLASSSAFQELRMFDVGNVQDLERQVIDKAEGIFLWVVLVTEKLVIVARDGNDLYEIRKVLESLPPGLEELYGEMRRRLPLDKREDASRMHQLVFQWNNLPGVALPLDPYVFWMAINCHDPTTLPPPTDPKKAMEVLSILERRLTAATGGLLQVFREPADRINTLEKTFIGYLHRTAFDWLKSIQTSIVNDGPPGYDPSLIFTSVLVARANGEETFSSQDELHAICMAGQCCRDSASSRASLLTIMDQICFNSRDISFRHRYSDSAFRSLFTIRVGPCVPYLQAKLESPSGATGLELPKSLRFMPRAFWGKSQKKSLSNTIDAIFTRSENRNLRFKVFEIFLQAQFAPRRAIRAELLQSRNRGILPYHFYPVLVKVTMGKGTEEMYSLKDYGPSPVPPRSEPHPYRYLGFGRNRW